MSKEKRYPCMSVYQHPFPQERLHESSSNEYRTLEEQKEIKASGILP